MLSYMTRCLGWYSTQGSWCSLSGNGRLGGPPAQGGCRSGPAPDVLFDLGQELALSQVPTGDRIRNGRRQHGRAPAHGRTFSVSAPPKAAGFLTRIGLFVPCCLDTKVCFNGFPETLLLEGHPALTPLRACGTAPCAQHGQDPVRAGCTLLGPPHLAGSVCVQGWGSRQAVEPLPSRPWHSWSRLWCRPSPVWRLEEGGSGVHLEVLLTDTCSLSWPHSSHTPGDLVSSTAPCFSSSVTSAFLAAPCPDVGHPTPLPPWHYT